MTKLSKYYSPNFNIQKRSKNKIKFIILHYTGMKKESSALKRLCDAESKVSAHYFIKKNGDLINLVPDLYEAWHAGKSSWKKIRFLNKYSIGIEIHNQGHNFKYEKFSFKQVITIKKLLKKLLKKFDIKLNNVLGHSDIAPERKKDPGEKFPWKELAKSKLAKWHKLNENKIKKFRFKILNKAQENEFLKNLYFLGYRKNKKINSSLNKKNIITAFQRRFRQSLINGKSDYECFMVSKNLLKS